MSVKERLKMYLKSKKISERAFASAINVSSAYVSSISRSIQPDKLHRISEQFPDLNSVWLLTGEGDMLKQKGDTYADNQARNSLMIPIYNAEASAGFGIAKLDSESIVGMLSVPYAKQNDVVITATGNSMIPIINSGDLLILRERHNWFEYVELGEIYVVVTEDDVLVKIIYSECDEKFTLKSANEEYKDFTVPKRIVKKVYRVVGTVTQRSIK